MDITLTLSPITPLDVQFTSTSPSPPIFGHPIPWNLLEAHGDSCLYYIYNCTLIFGLRDELQYIFSEEVVIFCLRVRSLLCLFVKGAYGCILDSRDPFRSNLCFISVIIIITVHRALAQPHFLFLSAVLQAGSWDMSVESRSF
ncbi:hypothetical protein Tco_0403850 [Tanacetum coccineum]